MLKRLWAMVLTWIDRAVAREKRPPVGEYQSAKVRRPPKFDPDMGPMEFLARKIVDHMNSSGYPATVVELYRSPERQEELVRKRPRVTNAGPFQSAHQYSLAADIIHPTKGWDVSEQYWEQLAAVVRIVAERYQVPLEHGHHWKFRDSAHVELRDWRVLASEIGGRVPTRVEMREWARRVLPRENF